MYNLGSHVAVNMFPIISSLINSENVTVSHVLTIISNFPSKKLEKKAEHCKCSASPLNQAPGLNKAFFKAL